MRAVGKRTVGSAVAAGGFAIALGAVGALGATSTFAAGVPMLSSVTYTAAAGTDGSLSQPMGVSAAGGTVFVSNSVDNVVASVAGNPPATTIVAGSLEASGEGPTTLYQPGGTAVDAAGDLFIADTQDNVVRELTPAGILRTVAGNGRPGFFGDGGPAVRAELDAPNAVAVDANGDLFIADTDNNVVREVTPNGLVHTVAGDGIPGYRGDGGPATRASLTQPTGVAVDSLGDLYIADAGNNVIRRVDTAGLITTVAGNFAADQANDGIGGYSGDGGPATSAQLHDPQGVAVDPAGDLFIADTFNNAIREVTPDGTISTVVNASTSGAPTAGREGTSTKTPSVPASTAHLNSPYAVGLDASTGTLYVADTSNNEIAAVTGVVNSSPTGPGPVAPGTQVRSSSHAAAAQ